MRLEKKMMRTDRVVHAIKRLIRTTLSSRPMHFLKANRNLIGWAGMVVSWIIIQFVWQ